MIARVPASSANLGPGFDTLAVALNRYVEVEVRDADGFSIVTSGYGAGRFDDEGHLGARVAASVLGHQRFSIRVDSQIPLSRGLGSSAALALAAAAAAGATDPLAIAVAIDGHAENAAASWRGGLVVAGQRDGMIAVADLALDDVWRFVVVIPEVELATADARRVLPDRVPFADAVANLTSLGLLIAGLADHRVFTPWAMDDRLHQPYRSRLLPIAAPMLQALRDSGALAACWSGAGSTMLGLTTVDATDAVAEGARRTLAEHGVAGSVAILEADRIGAVVS